MALERCDVEQLAHLAQLGLDDAQIESKITSLNTVLDMINAMQAVNTDNITPLANPLESTQRLRPDIVTESNHRDDYQSLAPAVEDSLYLVPKVID
ncbi:MAG TPA: Asp-tRNA(Asn)/Glu-tRNA(Gln) amidotransferase subunit GatC [Thiopseudomonas sp.]|nr:Asp-tRNA(Asn)/Glu-tRNA(Gln) amidotransferase subunit GatC [Thiopseudomonas sp.]